MLDEAENQLENGEPWMNPEAPVKESSENFGTERDVANCPFFLKTGACRFGDRCSRKHVYPTSSPTMVIRGMFTTFGMEQSRRDDYDVDASLEHSEEDLQESFLEFYHDVLPELKSVGKVVQFKVSCNYEPHLKGNVYVQFGTEEQCTEAIIRFNGRWYAGRQLHCEMCPVTRWKNAICGLFDRQKCPKGKHCNFLHVFRNPGNEFWEADRDLHLSPDRSIRGSRRDGWHSERFGDRSWRQRQSSRSPPRSERSHSRQESDRRRSRSRERSRERRASYQHREDRRSSRHSDRRNDWYLSRSRDRSRSRSKDREQDRLRHRSRGRDREHKYRNRSEERDSRDTDTDTRGKVRERSRSSSSDGNKKSREKSPKKADKKDGNTRRRHKQSKKSKKKTKKKHKKKSRLPEETSSSGESDKGRESEEETVKSLTVASPNETELIQKSNDVDESPCVKSEHLSPEMKNEQSNTEMPSEPAGNDDTSTS